VSRFLVLHARTHFRRNRGLQITFSCFAHPDSFSAVPRASGPIFKFCSPVLVFGGTEGVGSRLHVLSARTRFRRNRGRWRPNSFSTALGASGTIFMFSAPRVIFGGTEGVGPRFHVLRARTYYRRNRGRRVLFSCFPLPESFSAVTEGFRSLFHVTRAQTRFRRCRERRVPFSCLALPYLFSAVPRASIPFSCFALPDSFSAVSRALCPVFMF
jgi:hypothetical protein